MKEFGNLGSPLKHMPWPKYLSWIYAGLVIVVLVMPVVMPSIRMLAAVSFFYAPLCFAMIAVNLGLMLFLKSWRLPVAILTAIASLLFVRPWLHDLASNKVMAGMSSTQELKVATFNWKVTDGAKFSYFSNWIGAEKPDVVIVQEVPDRLLQNYRLLAGRYPYRTFSEAREDVIVISRFPIIRYDIVHVNQRPIVHAVIAAPWGRTDFYGLHAQTVHNDVLWALRSSYFHQANQILAQTEGHVIVAGDFNATVWDPVYQSLLNKGRLHGEPRLVPFTTRILATPEGQELGSPIDHVVVSQGLRISDCHTGPSMGSDHVPLTCVVQSAALK